MNDKMMQSKEGNVDSSKALDVGLVVTECNETESEWHVSSSRSEKYTHDEDVDINSVNDKQLIAKVQLTTEHNILANEQQHYEQSGSINDTYLLEKVDRNTTPNSTDMSHRGGEINQNAVKCQVSCPLLDPSFDNMTTEFSNQSLESEKIFQEWKHIVKTIENADLKAQIQEKVFANVALKNELRKLKGNSVDTKFAKPSILGKPFASQVDVNNDLPKPVTPHYLPKVREFVLAKPHHVIAPGSSRNSSEESYGSNDMAHNYYLEEAKKKTQDKNRNLKPREMSSARTHHSPNTCTPKPRSNNQTSRN
ncbi:hypothetical protein Tco_0648394 [Tanacetum coccineum]